MSSVTSFINIHILSNFLNKGNYQKFSKIQINYKMNTPSSNFLDSQSQNTSILSQKYKLVFLGDQSVGKTSIINRFIFDTFDGKDHV